MVASISSDFPSSFEDLRSVVSHLLFIIRPRTLEQTLVANDMIELVGSGNFISYNYLM